MSSESQHLLTAQQLEHDVIEQHGEERGEPIQQQQQQPSSTYGATTTARVVTIKDNRMVKPVGLSWHNLTVVHPKSGRVILDKVSGMALPGQLVALMGASGAGKTTLLNTLLSRNLKNLHVEGQVLVNGHELGSEITYVSGYVQQDELFMGTLTVKEHLLIQARLRLVGFSEKKIRRRVNEIIEELGLQDCRNSRIGFSGVKKGISGGEARRLLFASELLNNPPLIFTDEPTTGLDSSKAESMINLMHNLTKAGRTIICTIHQPSSTIYRRFDRVIFLASGRLAYFGEPTQAVELLKRFGYPCPLNYNPADAIIQNLSVEMHKEEFCRQRIRRICAEWDRSPEAAKFREEVEQQRRDVREKLQRRETVSWLEQTKSLLHRSSLDNWRNPGLARAKLIQKLIMGLFIGLLYFQTKPTNETNISDLNGAMFYVVAELTYSTLFGIITFLPHDFPLLVREYHDGLYNSAAYFVARALSYVPLFSLDGVVLVATAYWMTGLVPTVSRFLIALGIAILVEQTAAAFGVMLSTMCPSYPVAISVAGPLLTVLSLTGGLFANVGQLPKFISWVQYLSWFRYGFEAFAISQWEGALESEDCARNNNNGTAAAFCPTPESVLKKLSFKPDMFYVDIGAMLLLTFSCYFIGYMGLLFRVRRAR